MSIREQIKSAQDIQKQVLDFTDDWGCKVEVRALSGLQRAQIMMTCLDDTGKIIHKKFHSALVVASCYEVETGNRIFDDDDEEWVMEKSAGPIEQIVSTAMRLSGLTREASAKAEKNS